MRYLFVTALLLLCAKSYCQKNDKEKNEASEFRKVAIASFSSSNPMGNNYQLLIRVNNGIVQIYTSDNKNLATFLLDPATQDTSTYSSKKTILIEGAPYKTEATITSFNGVITKMSLLINDETVLSAKSWHCTNHNPSHSCKSMLSNCSKDCIWTQD